jgi:SAM-dependent methyltransferase
MKSKSEKDVRRLYSDLSWIWGIVSTPEEYMEESELFSRVIKEHSKIEVKTLLHLGCGRGCNDYTFKKHFTVTGLDISEEMLKLARKLNPEVTYICGDMRTVQLGKHFDAVAIPDSIGYMRSEEDLHRVFYTAYEHLKPGGAFLILVEESSEKFKQNRTTSETHSQGDVEIAFIENSYDPDPKDTTFETTFIFLVRRRGELEIFTDRHLGGIFKLETWHILLKETGFEVKEMKFEHSTFAEGESLPMLICTKP